jgi:hypothetical protein
MAQSVWAALQSLFDMSGPKKPIETIEVIEGGKLSVDVYFVRAFGLKNVF